VRFLKSVSEICSKLQVMKQLRDEAADEMNPDFGIRKGGGCFGGKKKEISEIL